MSVALLVLDAHLRFSGDREISIPAEEFSGSSHPAGARILREIFIPRPKRGTGASFIKLTRTRVDIAIVSAAALLVMRDGFCWQARIALGNAGPCPFRVHEAEKLMEGQQIDEDLLAKVGHVVVEAARPIGDHRATAEYRREMCGILAQRSFRESMLRAKEGTA
jgi:carbon-monoxide dehydrogenase medium subunit